MFFLYGLKYKKGDGTGWVLVEGYGGSVARLDCTLLKISRSAFEVRLGMYAFVSFLGNSERNLWYVCSEKENKRILYVEILLSEVTLCYSFTFVGLLRSIFISFSRGIQVDFFLMIYLIDLLRVFQQNNKLKKNSIYSSATYPFLLPLSY